MGGCLRYRGEARGGWGVHEAERCTGLPGASGTLIPSRLSRYWHEVCWIQDTGGERRWCRWQMDAMQRHTWRCAAQTGRGEKKLALLGKAGVRFTRTQSLRQIHRIYLEFI